MVQTTIDTLLRDLGLSQYADMFEENGIDMEVLGELTAGHLKEIGVTVLGHRLKIMKAIASLADAPDKPKPSDALSNVSTAERRHLTIMFCDLVGSTAISARIDPEDYRDLMTLYQETVSQVVTQAGGHVAKYLGDGVLIYFGYPIAQEDAAERACRAGFDIVQAVAALDPVDGNQLEVRLGIATGIVVVGDLYGDGVEEFSAVAGETPNLAARLQTLAAPGQIVVGNNTHALLKNLFVCEALDNVSLKGFEPGQRAWRVISESQSQERFYRGAGQKALSPLVGRVEECERLLAAWDAAKAGNGRVFMVSGEAGIGKSRLAHEVLRQAETDGALILNYQAAPYFTNTAFYPVRRQIETVLQFSDGDSPDDKLDKIERLIWNDDETAPDASALMGAFLNLPTDRYLPLNLSPALQKTRTVDMIFDQIVRRSRKRPVVLHFEDLHWIDPSSLDLLGSFIDKLTEHPILLLATFRPEFSHDWVGEHIDVCTLKRLEPSEIEALLDTLTDGESFTKEQRTALLERCDGVPLFAEELTRTVLEAEDPEIVPESLQDSLMARLDKIGESRELAQIGAAIGREFDVDLLAQVSGKSESEITGALDALVNTDLVLPSRDQKSWTFRHALLQEAAYRSMLRRRRQDLHGQIAQSLETVFPERCKAGPEQVANHFVAAGQGGRSVQYWLTAGRTAWQRASMKEALAHLGRGLEYVKEIADPADRAKQELQLQSTVGVVHFAATSYASAQSQAAFERARELFVDVDDVDLRIAVLYGIGAYETMKGDVGRGHATFGTLAEEVARSSNARYEVYSESMQAWSHFNCGHYGNAVWHGERVLELYDQGVWDQPGPRLSAADPRVISECFRAAALWSLGRPDKAVKVGEDVLAYARSLPDKYSLVYALSNGVIRVHDWTGNWQAVMDLTAECTAVAGEYGYGFLGLWASIWRARAMAQQGRVEEAEKMTAGAIAACKKAGVFYHGVCFEANHARILMMMDRVEEAATLVGTLDNALETSGEHSHAAELALVKAEVALAQKRPDVAAEHYRTAQTWAVDQEALSWQLRAALGLVPLMDDDAAGRALIAPLIAQIGEGTDTRDLVAAKAMLNADPISERTPRRASARQE